MARWVLNYTKCPARVHIFEHQIMIRSLVAQNLRYMNHHYLWLGGRTGAGPRPLCRRQCGRCRADASFLGRSGCVPLSGPMGSDAIMARSSPKGYGGRPYLLMCSYVDRIIPIMWLI